MANKRKTTTAIVAGVTAVALLLGGTFAWTSISQQARNEAVVDINPGGRLHDDFNGTNKDVYVENFGDNLTGVPIYARVRLDQYMEIGQQAGDKTITEGRKANKVFDENANINDTSTWTTYIPDADTFADGKIQASKYWSWDMGNDATDVYYMPTFNKNKDSLAADINGTYEGTVEGDKVHYDDYVVYGEGSTENGTEIYDWDSNTIEEEKDKKSDDVNVYSTDDPSNPIDYANVYEKSQNDDGTEMSHTAKLISSTASVILMEDWNGEAGNFWVYDTDGWAYWANPIMPGETTGLLLDGITMSRVPDDSWYYGINVVGQFATAGDLSAFTMNGEEMTEEAADLLASISSQGVTLVISGPGAVLPGEAVNFSATASVFGIVTENQPAVTYSVENVSVPGAEAAALSDDSGITVSGNTVTVTESAAEGITFDVKATATVKGKEYTAIQNVVVADWLTWLKLGAVGTTTKVEIDGIEWYMLARDEENARSLIWTADIIRDSEEKAVQIQFSTGHTFDSTIITDSPVKVYLNNDFLTSLTTLSGYACETTFTTANRFDRTTGYFEATDKVFLLSEADLNGTANNLPTTTAEEYTYNGTQLVTNDSMLQCSTGDDGNYADDYALRSPFDSLYCLASSSCVRRFIHTISVQSNPCLRPAMWVDLNATPSETPEETLEEHTIDVINFAGMGANLSLTRGTRSTIQYYNIDGHAVADVTAVSLMSDGNDHVSTAELGENNYLILSVPTSESNDTLTLRFTCNGGEDGEHTVDMTLEIRDPIAGGEDAAG